jgi:hypothetical protein
MSIAEIADAFERRQGANKKDTPQTFGEAALHQMDRDLRLAAADRPEAETFRVRRS